MSPSNSQYDDGVRINASTRDQLEAGVPPAPRAFVHWKRRNYVHAIDRAQSNGVHEVLWVDGDHRATCSCGLVFTYRGRLAARSALRRATGHRTLPHLGGPEWVLVTGTTTNRSDLDASVTCQRCGWSQSVLTWETADVLRRKHRAVPCTTPLEVER